LLGPLKVTPLAVALFTCVALSGWLGGYFRSALGLELSRIFVDDSTYVSNRLVSVRNGGFAGPKVVVVGGSVARESTPPDGRMKQLIADAYGKDVNFLNLGSSNQSTLSSLVIVQSLGLGPGDVLLMQYSFKKLDTPAALIRHEYLDPPIVNSGPGGFRRGTPASIHFGDRLVNELLPDVLLHRSFISNFLELRSCHLVDLLMHEQRQFCFREMPVVRHHYEQPLSPSEKIDYVSVIRYSVLPNFLQFHQINQQLILQAAANAADSGATVLFVNPPVDEPEYALQREVDAQGIFPRLVGELAEHGHYLDWRFDDSYESGMFRDSQHMLESGKEVFAMKLVDQFQMLQSGKEISNES